MTGNIISEGCGLWHSSSAIGCSRPLMTVRVCCSGHGSTPLKECSAHSLSYQAFISPRIFQDIFEESLNAEKSFCFHA